LPFGALGEKMYPLLTMQAQDGPAEFLFKLWPTLEKNKNTLIGVGVAIVVGSGIWYFVSSQRAQNEVDAGLALTTLLTSQTARVGSETADQYLQLAGKYAGTAAGQRARLQAAAALFDAGNFPEAQSQFQIFLDANSTGPFAAAAELGIAASLEAQGKLDPAAAAYQRVVSVYPDPVCLQSAELALGRIAEQQGKFTEAMNHYQDVARGFSGAVAQEAMIRAADLKAKMAAAPKPAVSNNPMVTPAPTPALTPMTVTIPQPATKP
jgi:predicted negative regulator of RcsB-dependent stress response